MATSEDIRQLIAILDEEGFGGLAGEILTELNLGREIEKDVAPDLNAHGTDVTTLVRVPYDEDDQFAAAMALLDLRLVAPARALAEAERIASRLGGEGTRLRFVDPVTQVETAPGERRTPGDATAADALADMVARLPNLRAAPLTGDA
jgi:hypothetical protein